MHCSQCGTENKPGRKFCANCGQVLSLACSECGFENDAGDKFCGGCGISLGDTNGTRLPNQEVSEPAADSVPDGELRQITVMFCDLADSTAMSNRMDPEQLAHLQGQYRGICDQAIDQFGGYVAKYMGDGILAYYGYPVAHEDDAERSIHSALQIQEQVEALNRSGQAAEKISVRIGVATGSVMVGELIGSGAAQENTVVGATPNLAARLQAIAKPGEIVVADESRLLAGSVFAFEDIGRHALKGFAGETQAWKATGEAGVQVRFASRAAGGLTPFVGRLHERRLVEDCFEQAADGQGQVLLFCGEPGIGKSRLIQVAGDLNPGAMITLQCSPHHQSTSLHPFVEFMRNLSEGKGGGEWIEEQLGACGVENPDAIGLFEKLLYDSTDRTISIPSAEMQKKRLLEFAGELLFKPKSSAPAIVVIEDLHWIDPTTQELVNLVVHEACNRSVLVLLSFRPEYQPPWVGQPHVHLLTLNRINPRHSEEMISSLVNSDMSKDVLEQIVTKTDGIPLFIEELVQSIQSGKPGSSTDIPATLADSLNARLDTLGPARSTAQAAAVIGRDFDVPTLSAVAQKSREDLAADVETLLESGLVFEMSESQTYRFKHALIQDTAYNSLLTDRKALFHRQAARFLADQEGADSQGAGLVAYHYYHAGNWTQAYRYWKSAGEYSLRTMAIAEALDFFDRSLETMTKLPADSVREEELAVHLSRSACYRHLENYEQALICLDTSEKLAEELKDIRSLADICHTRGNIFFPMANREGILAQHSRALDYARQLNSTDLEIRAIGGLGDAYYCRGEMADAVKKFTECCALAKQHGLDSYYSANRPMIGWSRIYDLEFREALEDGKQGVLANRACGNFRGEMNSEALLGFVYAEMGEAELSIRHSHNAMEMAERVGSLNFRAAFMVFSNRGLDEQQHRSEIYDLAKRAVAVNREYGMKFHGAGSLGLLMLVSDSPKEREAIRAEAEAVIEDGAVGHSAAWFYQFAMQTAINHREWDNLDQFREAVQRIYPPEKSAWARFFVERSRVLEAWYRDQYSDALESRRQGLLEICRTREMVKSAQELESIGG